MRLAIVVIHCDKGRKVLNASQIKVNVFKKRAGGRDGESGGLRSESYSLG